MSAFFNLFDYTVFVIYLVILMGMGFYLKKKASGSLEDYFLGGRNMPWWVMGFSGMASYLSLAGSMVIVSFLYYMGPQGLYIAFRGGACLVLVVMMVWSGKWHRRSGCITGAEFLKFRFGSDGASQLSRVSAAVVGFISTIGLLSLIAKGLGVFLSMFLPYSPITCSLFFVTIVTIYTIFSGFYGVVVTDVIQMILIIIGVIFICIMAVNKLTLFGGEFETIVYKITNNPEWFSSLPSLKASMPSGYETYQYVVLLAAFALLNNVIFGTPAGADPKQLACRTDKDCSKMTIMWAITLVVRWPLMIAFVVLGMFLVNNMFANLDQFSQIAVLIKTHLPEVNNVNWTDAVSGISLHPENYAELVSLLQSLLGDNWQECIIMLDYYGNINSEAIIPAVMKYMIPPGMRGIIMIALIAASMSSFDSAVNATAGLFTRDIYQNLIRPKAEIKELILSSYVFIVVLVTLGFLMAFTVRNINDIWGWIVMSLGTGMVVPSTLRYFWWRFNAWGFNAGLLFGAFAAVFQRALYPEMDVKIAYIIIFVATLFFSVVTTLMTKPTASDVLENYYLKVRPFGLWRPFKNRLTESSLRCSGSEHKRDLWALPFSLIAHVTLMLSSMQIILRLWYSFAVTFGIFVLCVIILYFVWYRHLDKMDYAMDFQES